MLCSQGEMRLLIFILVGATIIFSQDEGIDSIEVHPCDSPLIELKNNDEKRARLMKAIDHTNTRYGRFALSIAQAGLKKGWNIKRQHSSKIDTACFELLPAVRVS